MDVPAESVEVLIRLLTAVGVTVVTAISAYGTWLLGRHPGHSLYLFLTGAVALSAAWRWYILWLGIRPDVAYNEPLVRTVGAALFLLVMLAIGMLMLHHSLRILRQRRGS